MSVVTIYTRRLCPYCIAARRLLSSLGLEFEEIRLDGRPELRRDLSDANGGWSTVPMIFAGDRFIGGYDDLRRMHRDGDLMRWIRPAAGSTEG